MLNDCSNRHQRHILQTGQGQRLLGADAELGFAGSDHRIGPGSARLYNLHIKTFLRVIAQLLGSIQAGMIRVRRPVQGNLDRGQSLWCIRGCGCGCIRCSRAVPGSRCAGPRIAAVVPAATARYGEQQHGAEQ